MGGGENGSMLLYDDDMVMVVCVDANVGYVIESKKSTLHANTVHIHDADCPAESGKHGKGCIQSQIDYPKH